MNLTYVPNLLLKTTPICKGTITNYRLLHSLLELKTTPICKGTITRMPHHLHKLYIKDYPDL